MGRNCMGSVQQSEGGGVVNHTPEPWIFDEDNRGVNSTWGYGLISENASLNVTVHARKPKGDGFNSVDIEAEAIAAGKRIVECVNACVNIPNPAEAIAAAREALNEASDSLMFSTRYKPTFELIQSALAKLTPTKPQ